MPCYKINYFYFQGFNHGTGISATNLFKVSLHRVLCIRLHNPYAPLISKSPKEKSQRVQIDVN